MVFVLLFLVVVAAVAALALIGYGVGALNRNGFWRGAAALSGAVAVALYAVGLLHVAAAALEAEDGGTDSSPLRPCRTPGHWERALSVVDYTVDYVPLAFVCETSDGGTFTADSVPGYVNPAVLGSAATAAACAAAAAATQGALRAAA